MVLVLCYDVVDDGRRTRLFKRLKGFLTPVQASVFEGDLPDRRWNELLRAVGSVVDHETDTVRIYRLCRSCVGGVTYIGTAERLRGANDPILI